MAMSIPIGERQRFRDLKKRDDARGLKKLKVRQVSQMEDFSGLVIF